MTARQMTSRLKSDIGPYVEFRVMSNLNIIGMESFLVFPVRLRAVGVPGGWRRAANNRTELRDLIMEGLFESSCCELLVSWNPKEGLLAVLRARLGGQIQATLIDMSGNIDGLSDEEKRAVGSIFEINAIFDKLQKIVCKDK